MDESVIFELQVEKKVLEQVFKENKHLKDSYTKLIKNEDTIKSLKDEITNLKNENKDLNNENTKLRKKIEELEEKKKSSDLEQTESKLLKMKLEKMETEKSKILEQHKTERKALEDLLRDKSEMIKIEERLMKTSENLKDVTEELNKTKKTLETKEAETRQLDKDKLNLEIQVKNLTKKLRLEEEKNKSNDLAHVECKLLKLKLHTIETERNYLMNDFERERKILTKQNKPRVAKLEENLRHLRRWIEKEARERRPHDTDQVKSLKAQIAALESAKTDLIEGFELERKVFRKILKENGNSECNDLS